MKQKIDEKGIGMLYRKKVRSYGNHSWCNERLLWKKMWCRLETGTKKQLEEIIEKLESNQIQNWKEFIEENEDKFEEIKIQFKQKQKELTELVRKRRVISITDEEFKKRTEKLQQELYKLESIILKFRLKTYK